MPVYDMKRDDIVEYRIIFSANLGPGSYSVAVALTSSDTHLGNNYEWRDLALLFSVVNNTKPIFAGNVWLDASVSVVR